MPPFPDMPPLTHPVWLYVGAWLLPLASFVLLVLGGRHWGRVGAVVAIAAIVGSFVLSFYGFMKYMTVAPNVFVDRHVESAHGAGEHGGHAAEPKNEPEEPTGPDDLTLPPGSQKQIPLRPVGAGGPAPAAAGNATNLNASAFSEIAAGSSVLPSAPWKAQIDWITVGSRKIHIGFYVDNLTALMFLMVTFIASLIHIYSFEYMHEELHDPVRDPLALGPGLPALERRGRHPRFFTYLSLFCFSMLGLVISDNIFMVFIFWELVGICSYLLIGFYYERKSASTAANKAFITNRVGDAGMIVGLMIIWTSFGTFNIQDVTHTMRDGDGKIVRLDAATGTDELRWDAKSSAWREGHAGEGAKSEAELGAVQLYDHKTGTKLMTGIGTPARKTMPYWLLTLAGIGVFIGCMGKSAQFPLHVWLPDAMEGPTPVSALIHAATMVAAGVYLTGRFYALFTPEALLFVAYIGGITLFIAGTIALVATDIKKVLAYSTVSQLGYMMLGLGVGGLVAGLFHLITHAFFKALLFLGSGSVIHGTGTQEMPQMGGLFRKMPITAITMLIGVLAICGIPCFSGYYSKDAIVAQALLFWRGDASAGIVGHPGHAVLFLLPAIGAGITAFYMFRLYFMTFAGKPRDRHIHDHAHESKKAMWLPLTLLAIPSIVVAYGAASPYVSGSTPLLERALDYRPPHIELFHPAHEIHQLAGSIALAVVLFGIALSALFYFFRVLDPAELPRQFPGLYRFLANKWYFDELYDAALIRPALAVAHFCRRFDWNVVDRFIDGLASWTVKASRGDGWFDNRVIDGTVNFVGDFTHATGVWLRRMQTGQLRQYILFLAVAAVGLIAVIHYLAPHIWPELPPNVMHK